MESVAALRAHGAEEPAVVACTPKACIELLDRHNIDIEGKRAVVLAAPTSSAIQWRRSS